VNRAWSRLEDNAPDILETSSVSLRTGVFLRSKKMMKMREDVPLRLQTSRPI